MLEFSGFSPPYTAEKSKKRKVQGEICETLTIMHGEQKQCYSMTFDDA